MYWLNCLKYIYRYIKHQIIAGHINGHGIHSPYIYKLCREVIFKSRTLDNEIEKIRNIRLKDRSHVQITDLGAGSTLMGKSSKRTIRHLTRSTNRKKISLLLARLNEFSGIYQVIELGTSLGFSTLYLSRNNIKNQIVTLEGCPNISSLAQENFNILQVGNIRLISGAFDDNLKKTIQDGQHLFVFIDGNHTYKATIRYFEFYKKHITPDSMLIFDDIHWSDGMQRAWNEIKSDQAVKVSIDLFYVGIILFKNDLHPQHFKISFF
jgi:predicted O-methyltransferase YrrM